MRKKKIVLPGIVCDFGADCWWRRRNTADSTGTGPVVVTATRTFLRPCARTHQHEWVSKPLSFAPQRCYRNQVCVRLYYFKIYIRHAPDPILSVGKFVSANAVGVCARVQCARAQFETEYRLLSSTRRPVSRRLLSLLRPTLLVRKRLGFR